MSTYSTFSIPVRGGYLSVGTWGSPASTPLLAIHGVTANHLAWEWLSQVLPDRWIIAPDLRGRGDSGDLEGPWGMSQHADDLHDVLGFFDIDSVEVVGHSMGGFVAATFAHRYPLQVHNVLLVDGGIPIPKPENVSTQDLPTALIGPAAERLHLSFDSEASYFDYWKKHPAFETQWSSELEKYFAYDLTGQIPHLRSKVSGQAMEQDSLELALDVDYPNKLAGLRVPTTFLRVERGLFNQVPPLYPNEQIAMWSEKLPNIEFLEIPELNHYTITMSADGVRQLVQFFNDRTTSQRDVKEGSR